jgi:hypothetical protein
MTQLGRDSAIKIVIRNYLKFDAVYFVRGAPGTTVYDGPGEDAKSYVGSKNDCTLPFAGAPITNYNCQPATVNNTFFFELASIVGRESPDEAVLYLKAQDEFDAGIIWAAPRSAVYNNRFSTGQDDNGEKRLELRDIALGPDRQSGAEFSITTLEKKPQWGARVSYDATFVNGLSYGVNMSYVDRDGNTSTVIASNPTKIPNSLKSALYNISTAGEADSTDTFTTVLSDQYTADDSIPDFLPQGYSYTNNELAQCPSHMAYLPSGQHFCRLWYYYSYKNPESFCGWLAASRMQGYCWAMDEWICKDEFCGAKGEREFEAPQFSYNTPETLAMDLAFADPAASTSIVLNLNGILADADDFSAAEGVIRSAIIAKSSYVNISTDVNVSGRPVLQKMGGPSGLTLPNPTSNYAFTVTDDLSFWQSGGIFANALYNFTFTPSFIMTKTDPVTQQPIKFRQLGVQLAFSVAFANTKSLLNLLTQTFDAAKPPGDTSSFSYIISASAGGQGILRIFPNIIHSTVTIFPTLDTVLTSILESSMGKNSDLTLAIQAAIGNSISFEAAVLSQSPYTLRLSFTAVPGKLTKSNVELAIKTAIAKDFPLVIFRMVWRTDATTSPPTATLDCEPIDTVSIDELLTLSNQTSPLSAAVVNALSFATSSRPLINRIDGFYGETAGNGQENNYSCGKLQHLPTPSGEETWWNTPESIGAVDNDVTVIGPDGKPSTVGRNPQPPRNGGTFTIDFIHLEFTGTSSGGGGDGGGDGGGGGNDGGGNNVNNDSQNDDKKNVGLTTIERILLIVGSIVVGIILIVIICAVIYIIVSRNK